MSVSEFNDDGSLKVSMFDNFHEDTRNVLLLSNKIIEVKREVINWDTPQECDLHIIVPRMFNIKRIAAIFMKLKESYPSLGYMKYKINGNKFTLNIKSGSKRHSFCKYFFEKLDKELPQELILVKDYCDEWYPDLRDKLEEDEYVNIMDEMFKRRIEYFAKDTNKYRFEVLKRDGHKCLSCSVNGKTPYKRRNGEFMTNPLQIHHLNYHKDSPDSLITLCNVCHYKLHLRLLKQTGKWSSKKEDMHLIK